MTFGRPWGSVAATAASYSMAVWGWAMVGSSGLGALTGRQAALVEAAAARIFPTTDTPGATEAGVVTYVDRALADVYPELLPLYRGGCRALASEAKRRFNADFLRLTAEQQDALLTDFEAGTIEGYANAATFFGMLRTHTMEGVLGEPAYGGNRDLVGWKLVGFPGHQFGYDDAYVNNVVDIPPKVVARPYATREEWDAE